MNRLPVLFFLLLLLPIFVQTVTSVQEALATGNPTVCMGLDSIRMQGQCYEEFGVLWNDTEFCELAGDYRSHCYYRLGGKLSDAELCKKAGPFNPQCYHDVAVALGDLSFCENSDSLKGQCIYDIGQKTRNPGLCQLTGEQEEECLCNESEKLVNHECRRLNCRDSQYISNHRCINIECAEHFSPHNHTCVPDFKCRDSDDLNVEKKSTCKSPRGDGTDRCTPDNSVIEYACSAEGLVCEEERVYCEPYCQERNYTQGQCIGGICACYTEPIERCDYLTGFGKRTQCYQQQGVEPLKTYFQVPSTNRILFLIILSLAIYLSGLINGRKKWVFPSFWNLQYWAVRAVFAVTMLLAFIVITSAPWYLCLAVACIFFAYVWNRLQQSLPWHISNLWSWWFRISYKARGAGVGAVVGYFLIPGIIILFTLLYFIEDVLLAFIARDFPAISVRAEGLSKMFKEAWPLSRYLFSRYYALLFGGLPTAIGGVLGYHLGRFKGKNPRGFKRFMRFLMIGLAVLAILLTQSWRAMS